MHMPIQFDTLDYAKRLASSGVPTVQAEAHAAALGEVLGSVVVGHGELAAVECNVLGEIKLVRQEMQQLEQKIDARFDTWEHKIDARFDAWEHKIDARFDAREQKINSRFDAWEQKINSRFDAWEQKINSRFNAWEQKISSRFDGWEQRIDSQTSISQHSLEARLDRMDLRHGADMKHVYWMMGTLILLNMGILSRLVLQ